ncbi:MAG: hypothetical protein AAGA58_16875 [Verrucomicrobiota bacterium]
MNWTKEENRGDIIFTLEVAETPKVEIFKEVWNVFSNQIIELNSGINWDFIMVEFWLDSGRVIIFPSARGSFDRIEKALCQVFSEKMLSTYEELVNSGIDDNEFDKRLRDMRDTCARYVEIAAKESALANLELAFWDADEELFQEVKL